MKRPLSVASVCVALAACDLPERDNGNDPTVRPEARLAVRALRVVGTPDDADLVIGNVFLRSSAEPQGSAEDWFLADATGSFDPNQDPESLEYGFLLGGTPQTYVAELARCPAGLGGTGVQSNRCRVFRPEDVSLVTSSSGIPVRNAPIEVALALADRELHVDEARAEVFVVDSTPVAQAGADAVLPVDTCPGCTRPIFLNGNAADADPIPGDEVDVSRSYCWEQVPLLGGDCSAIAAATITEPSPVVACPTIPATADPNCFRSARGLRLDFPTEVQAGGLPPPSARFRLFTADRYAWGTSDVTDVRVGIVPLWFRSPVAAERFPASLYRMQHEAIPNGSGGSLPDPYRPTVANGPDGQYAYVALDEGPNSNVFWAQRIGVNGFFQYFGFAPSNEGHELQVQTAAHDASGRLWVVALADEQLYPNHLFLAAIVGNAPYSSPLGVGECDLFSPNVWCTKSPPDLLAADASTTSAFGATRGGTEVDVYTVAGGGLLALAPLSVSPPFDPIQALETSQDGRLFVATVTGIRVFDQGVEQGPITGLGEVDAIRYVSGSDQLLVNAPETGIWILSLSGSSPPSRIFPAVGPANAVRLADDGRVWVSSRASNEVLVADPAASFLPPESIVLEGSASGTSGVLSTGSPIVSIGVNEEYRRAVVRLPSLATALTGRSPSLGTLQDATYDRDRGGAWFAYSDPPSIVQCASDGSPFPETRFDSVNVGGIDRPIERPWKIATDAKSRALWIIDTPDPTLQYITSRWTLAERPSPGVVGPVTGLAYMSVGSDVTGETVYSMAPAIGGTDPTIWSAWAFSELENKTGKIVFMRRNGTGFIRIIIPTVGGVEYPVGPTTTNNGTAWFAKCQSPVSGALNLLAGCGCSNPFSGCNIGVRLMYAAPGASSMTEFAPGTDLGNCGTFCSVYPLDVAYDTTREVLWLAALDHGNVTPPSLYRFWRFSCATGGPLNSCTPANVRSAQRVPVPFGGPVDPLETALMLKDQAFEDVAREWPDLLGIDPGTGHAYFLDPVTGEVHILAYDGTAVPPVIRRVGSFATDAIGHAIDR